MLKRLIVTALYVVSLAGTADEVADREALRAEIEYLVYTGYLRTGDTPIAAGNLIAEVYGRRGYMPAWTDTGRVAELISSIQSTEDEGLDPRDYNLGAVEEAYASMTGGMEPSPTERAVIEVVLTDSLIRLGYHQLFGKVNPASLDPNWNFSRTLDGVDTAAMVLEAIDSSSLSDSLRALAPRGWFYSNLQTALADYRRIAAQGGWPRVPDGPTLKPGALDERLAILARRLLVEGDLAEAPAEVPTIYEGALVEAVERFQSRHGIDVDGAIGPATLRALNVPVEQRITQLALSLERARWVMRDLADSFILVNIAGFRAYVIRNLEIVWQTRVQVGSTYRKTPLFGDEMEYVVLNPTWTVPYSIATRDVLPRLQRDPGYLTAGNFEVRDRNGTRVDPAGVDWSALGRNRFPYTLVQRPGPDNALGRIKFMFPNEHAVYLHDTPSRTLFGKAERAFSSGCIRVEHPFELAELLLGSEGWTPERFQEVLDSGETKTVFLSRPMPVLLLYWTAEVNKSGTVYFYSDIYDRDRAVAEALAEPFRIERPDR